METRLVFLAAMDVLAVAPLAVFAAVFFGQFMVARAVLGWVHSKAMSDKIFPMIAVAAGFVVIAGLLVMLSKVGLHGPRLLRGGAWADVPWAWNVYIAVSLAALVIGVTANVRAERRREPAVQVSKTTRHLDLAQALGRAPSGRGLRGLIARLPGNELFFVDVIERRLRLDTLPPAWRGMTIVHLSDLHLCGTPDRTYFEKATELVNELAPDLIVLTGDVIDTQRVGDWLATTLGRMRAPLGCYFVLGNHDEHSRPATTRAELARLGWVDVAGRCVRVEHRGGVMEIGGTERPWIGVDPAFSGEVPREVHDEVPRQFDAEMRSGGPASGVSFRVLLSHAPERISWAARSGVDLMFAGHLHGGQICLPLLGPVKSGRIIAGIFQEGATTMHLSRGLGEMMPIRWRCRPEITKIILE